MSYRIQIVAITVLGFAANLSAQGWVTKRIHERFYTEGASAGDIDGDGIVDIVTGPLWFKGPQFTEGHELAPAREFPISTYSDQFFSSVFDANADGANDVLVIGFPGQAARLYLNPGKESLDEHWKTTNVADVVDNESPRIVDFVPGGLPEIVCGNAGQYGFYQAGENASAPWTWHAVTEPGACSGRFAHGLGVGDVNGDGRLDIVDRTFWWEQPAQEGGQLWKKHQWATDHYGGGGAQIHIHDVDDDGDSDIVTSLNAHGFGLAWFEQTEPATFVRHDLMGTSSLDNDYGVVFSQLHAVELADIDGDGRKDIVTGKRFWAHQGKDAGGLQEPVLYWFRCVSEGDRTTFVPHLIHRDSGVGVDVLVTDLNGDSKPDIVTSSKRGFAIHTQEATSVAMKPQRWKITEGRDQTKYADGLEPKAAAEQVLVPDGFSVDLIASEPELTQPIAMCFDARGRIWVIEGHTYPNRAPDGEGKDRVIILEDTDADGSFETKKTFITGLNLASGIEVGFGGVWIGAAPYLLFIPDEELDGVPDAKPQILLDGWGYQDTHETLNSFTWGPDGWLYGCHGVFTHSKVGKPGTQDNERTRLNAGVWRYHPTEHRFEVFAHGTSNPWGVDFNDQGDCFITACVIPHLYHMQQGARYQRQGGQHFNPHTYDDIKTIADHLHYSGRIQDHAFWGENSRTKPEAPLGTSLVGGGHAHCGLAIYNADVFPKEYYGDLFFHNLHGHRVVRERLEREGSGYIGKHRPDLSLARDHKEIGVGVMVGPDGALYTSDWHDIQTCHNRLQEVWDRTDGRIFRVRYGEVRPQAFDLWKETDAQLVGRLASGNAFFARQAQRILQRRAHQGTLDDQIVLKTLDDWIANSPLQKIRLRAAWAKYCIGKMDAQAIQDLLSHEDAYLRAWGVHFIGETYRVDHDGNPTGGPGEELAEKVLQDPSPVVRRYLASLLQRLPTNMRPPIIEKLAMSYADAHDRNIPLLVWYGMEPLVEQSPAWAYSLAQKSSFPDLLRYTIRRLADTPGGRDQLVEQLLDPNETRHRLTILEEINGAATRRAGLAMPKRWPEVFAALASAPSQRVQTLARGLSVQFGDDSILPHYRQVFGNAQAPAQQRLDALTILRNANDSQLPAAIIERLDDAVVNTEAIAALAQFNEPAIANALLKRFDSFQDKTRTAALSTLVARKSSAAALVDAMESGKVPASSVPAFIIRQALSLGDNQLNERLEKAWGRIAPSSEEKKALYAKYRQVLQPAAIAGASAGRGRLLYEENCGKCHKLFGVGGDIGPEITGANRTQVDYWLENILEPNALIGKAYQVTSFLTDDGRVINGVIKSENEDAVSVQTATELIVLSKDIIEARNASKASLMPEGQLIPMSDQQVLDLFKYLMSPTQVAAVKPPVPGTVFIEGETIKSKPTAGTANPQAMNSFGNQWSGNSQLWWTGGSISSELSVPLPEISGSYDVVIHLTSANDYARVAVSIGDTEPRVIDLYSPTVSLAEPMAIENVRFSRSQRQQLIFKIVGANEQARKSLMVGIDQIQLIPNRE